MMFAFVGNALLVACSPTPSSDIKQQANDLMALARDNPVDASAATWRDKGTLTCLPKTKSMCTPRGCVTGPVNVRLEVTPSSGSYRRCGPEGCDQYTAAVSHSGIWTTLALPENSLMLRLTGSGRFMEVAAIGDEVLVYHGACTAESR